MTRRAGWWTQGRLIWALAPAAAWLSSAMLPDGLLWTAVTPIIGGFGMGMAIGHFGRRLPLGTGYFMLGPAPEPPDPWAEQIAWWREHRALVASGGDQVDCVFSPAAEPHSAWCVCGGAGTMVREEAVAECDSMLEALCK